MSEYQKIYALFALAVFVALIFLALRAAWLNCVKEVQEERDLFEKEREESRVEIKREKKAAYQKAVERNLDSSEIKERKKRKHRRKKRKSAGYKGKYST